MRRKILIITTGGTISMKHNSPFGVIPNDEFAAHLKEFPQLAKIAIIDVYEHSNIPSPFMTPQKMVSLANLVDEKISNYDGVVITHGTDTLEETAYMLDLILQTRKPIVFTAAMRSGSELGLDGPRNIVGAVRVAGSSKAANRGVLVVMNDEINSARDVTKTDSSKTDSFISPSLGLLGIIDPDKIIFYRKTEIYEKIETTKIETNIDLIKCSSGMDGRFLEASVQNGAKAIVIEAFGRGNIPQTMLSAIEKVLLKDILIIIVSRTYTGRVLPEYGYEGGGLFLQNLGCIMGEEQKGTKMRIKLMALFGKFESAEKVRNYLTSQK
ncbi:MAG: asparaginase [Candidatus Cloacimonetes bacterium]|jgi:L-asparaginase|nr:asparaginase [Candidatus Cloacimonadota bacterium]MBT6994556.1 asparaginase [Candidatus Cloacimonadota bacterium]MBT7468877.1 asparaginase [Candidatus Cloacimonadota bacterium]